MQTRPEPSSPGFDLTAQRLAGPTAVMALGTALSRATGLLRIVAMAAALGVAESRLADSYNIANTTPNVIYELVLGGVLTSVFVPVVVHELRASSRGWEGVSAVVCTAFFVLAVITLLTVAVAPWMIGIFSGRVPGAQGAQQQELATFFLRVFAPQVALYGFVAIGDGLLNAHGRFALPAFAPILNNVVVIATFTAFAVLVGGTPTNESVSSSLWQKLLLAGGTTGGVAAMALVYWPALRALPGRVRLQVDFRHPAVRRLARLSAWTVAYVVTNMAGLVVSFYLANGLQGGPTAYVIAFAFFQLPIGVAAISIVTALTPKLAAHHVDGDMGSFRARVAGGLRLTSFLMLPATAAYLVLGHPIARLLLEHGVATDQSAALVASALQLFAVGLLPFAAYQLLMRAFYARQDARAPALLNVVENAATIVLDFVLFPSMGVEGLALAHSLGYVVGCAVAVPVLTRQIGPLETRRTVLAIVKTGGAALAAGVAMLLAARVVAGVPGTAGALTQLFFAGAAGAVVFAAAVRLLRITEVQAFGSLIRRARALKPARSRPASG